MGITECVVHCQVVPFEVSKLILVIGQMMQAVWTRENNVLMVLSGKSLRGGIRHSINSLADLTSLYSSNSSAWIE